VRRNCHRKLDYTSTASLPLHFPLARIGISNSRIFVGILCNRLANLDEKFPHSSSHSTCDLARNHWRAIRKLRLNRAAQSASIVACVDDQELRPSEEGRAIWNTRRSGLFLDAKAIVIIGNNVARFCTHVGADKCRLRT
jgi:hypothetical protein